MTRIDSPHEVTLEGGQQGDESQVPELKNFSAKKDSPRLAAGKSSQSLLSTGSSLPLTSRVSQARSEKRMDFLRRHASHRSCGGVRHMTLKSRRDVSFDELSPSYSEVSISEAQQDPIDLHVANYFRKQTEAQQDAKQAQQVDVPRPGILTILSCIALCTNTILGAGTLAVPFTMSLTGFVLYHVIVVLVLVANFASLRWLVDVAEVLPEDVPPSYEGIAHHFLGGTADAVISAAMVFGGFALTMAYMLFITTSLSSVLVAMKAFSGLSKEAVHTGVLFGVGLCFVLPLTLMKDISRLRWTSALAVLILGSTTVYVVVSSSLYLQDFGIHRGSVPVKLSSDIFDAIPMSVGAYACQILVLPIYDSLGPGRSPAMMGIVLLGGLGLATIVYEGVGIMGYLQFGDAVQSNILQNLISQNDGSILSITVSLGMALTLICHVPCVVWPLRSCLISAYHYAFDFEHAGQMPSDKEWYVTSVLVMGGVLLMACLFPEIKTALSVVGSVGGACIVFIYPAAFHLSAVKRAPFRDWFRYEHFTQVFMMLIGFLFGVFCFGMAVRNSLSK